MSGELKPKVEIKVGQELSARWRVRNRADTDRRKAVVISIARVWAKAQVEDWRDPIRFRIDTGLGDDASQFHLDIPEVLAYEQRIRDAWKTLKEHGLRADEFGVKTHDADLFAVAAYLELQTDRES
jgi:hypothetical protein